MEITYKQYEQSIQYRVDKELELYEIAPSIATVENNVDCIIETRPSEKIMIVKDNWRELIDRYIKSGRVQRHEKFVCPYCKMIDRTKHDKDLLCADCRLDFGHDYISQL